MKQSSPVRDTFLIFLRLGLTAFGGPVAHLGYFREEFVHRRRWLSDAAYADLVALCQFLPGPASSQVGLALGLQRAGYRGALAAWCGFTLPSAILLILFAIGLVEFGDRLPGGLIAGLKIVAVTVVAQAVWGMAKSLCPDWPRRVLALAAAAFLLALPSAWSQIGVIIVGGLIGLSLKQSGVTAPGEALAAGVWLLLFFLGLAGLPLLAQAFPGQALAMVDAFYRAGALVFGGGHVVLPLLQAETVAPGWIGSETFLAGYGAAQAVPGPLFTFAAFLGAAGNLAPNGWGGGLLALAAIFLPAFLLLAGALPFWDALRTNNRARAALAGVNAVVVGILLAALYDPVWTSAIHGPLELLLAALAFTALMFGKQAPWRVVAGCALAGALLL
ncbi:chromate efflux transporter [uncultured Azonexus sp.]|uniref:chromate efflux transporter n=1 Tax=uncultured Azonexus sp. TaxID=520307 RepID=UPI00261BBD98|nr:chromate efflux transporter [uncultured Azonexus sp.]